MARRWSRGGSRAAGKALNARRHVPASLPATVPVVGPEAQERAIGPSPRAVAAMARAVYVAGMGGAAGAVA